MVCNGGVDGCIALHEYKDGHICVVVALVTNEVILVVEFTATVYF